MTEAAPTHKYSRFHMAQCIGALSIEVSTGMRHSQGSLLKLVRREYGIQARTKVKALDELHDLYEAIYGTRYGQR